MTNRCWPGHATENGNQRTSSEKYGKRERSDSKLRFGYSQQLAKTSSLDAEVRRLHQTRMAQKTSAKPDMFAAISNRQWSNPLPSSLDQLSMVEPVAYFPPQFSFGS